MKRVNGFSLIELMVVIAIVAVLAAVALPAYKNYILKGKIVSAMSTLDALKETAIQYYHNNGTFPNVAQLGLNYSDVNKTPDPNTVNDYYAPPFVAQIRTNVSLGSGSYSCSYGTLAAFVSNVGDGVYSSSNLNAGGAFIDLYIYDANGIIKSLCFYEYATDYSNQSTLSTADLIPGCQNVATTPNFATIISTALNGC